MIGFLLAISIILTIVALFAIVVLYLRQNRLFEIEKKQEKMFRDMEEVISTYLYEMKEENEEFIKRIQKLNLETENTSNKENTAEKKMSRSLKDEAVNLQEKELGTENTLNIRVGKTKSYQAAKAYKTSSVTKAAQEKGNLPLEDEPILPPIYNKTEEQNQPEVDERTAEELYMKSLYQQALLLKNQGMDEAKIAKKLNKGKTEIELLLKFRQND